MPQRTKDFTSYAHARKRSDGFALAGLLIFTPVLLALLFGISVSAEWLIKYTEKQSSCINEIFSVEHSLSIELNKLFDLNNEAYALRLAHQMAIAKLTLATTNANVPAIIVARHELIKVQLQKGKLQLLQNKILAKMQILSAQGRLSIRYRLIRNKVKIHIPPMQIVPESITEVASPYRAKQNFRKQQIATVNYKIENAPLNCLASIENRDGLFRATLVQAN